MPFPVDGDDDNLAQRSVTPPPRPGTKALYRVQCATGNNNAAIYGILRCRSRDDRPSWRARTGDRGRKAAAPGTDEMIAWEEEDDGHGIG
jgi:hypothetical protein